MNRAFAVDIGGTFTDVVVLDDGDGSVRTAKTPTTPAAPADGVLAAVAKLGVPLAEARSFFHGTTLGLNLLLQRAGARTGLITTRGHRDMLELGRSVWPPYQLYWEKPKPLVPRYLCREVDERMRADGVELEPLDEDAFVREADYLLGHGVEAIAVVFLHAYAFPEHERRAGQLLERHFPGMPHALSHRVAQEIREYERACTTVADCSVKPVMGRYVDVLAQRLASDGFSGSFSLTRCDGGVMSAAEAKERPIRTLISGPASGVMGAITLGRWLGTPNVIGCDMGGTSFDAFVVVDGEPRVSTSAELGGVPMLMPLLEIATIGAGGGSLAWIDPGGALNVGPQSAGADPGPICYGKGGRTPTFTDAALVAGLLGEHNFLGGELSVDIGAARRGIEEQIAKPLGLGLEAAASGIIGLTVAKMSSTLEELTIERGHDPREFSLLAYGGGGALVAEALARRLGIPRVVVPRSPGTFSAWGMLTLDVVHDFARTEFVKLAESEPSRLRGAFAYLEEEAEGALEREGVPPERRALVRTVEMRYLAQDHVLPIPLTGVEDADLDAVRLRAAFEAAHHREYGFTMPDPVEITGVRIRAAGTLDKPKRSEIAPGPGVQAARKGTRPGYDCDGVAREWTVYDRELLGAGARITGPAIVEEAGSTTVVGAGQELVVDALGNLIIAVEASAEAPSRAGSGAAVDPITFAVIRNSLLAAPRAAASALRRAGMAPLIYEYYDFGISVYDERLNCVGEWAGVPLFTGALDDCIAKTVAAVGGPEALRPGDVLINNHPHLAAAQTPDMALIAPVFAGERMIGYAGLRAHMGDVGAISYYPTNTKEIYQEGLILPPLKLYDAGKLNEAVIAIIRANSRLPDITAGNVLAAANCLGVAASAIAGVADKYGVDTYYAVIDRLLDHGERIARDGIARIPDGEYTMTEVLADNGVDRGAPVPLVVTVRVEGDQMTVDTSGSAGQQGGPINCPWGYTQGTARLALKCLVTSGIPSNSGEHRALTLVAPEGSIFNPSDTQAPCFLSWVPAGFLVDMVVALIAEALPQGLPAMNGHGLGMVMPFLHNRSTGARGSAPHGAAPGYGARRGGDGMDALKHLTVANSKQTPAEIVEREGLVIRRSLELVPDSGGPGRWRGGLASRFELECLGHGEADASADPDVVPRGLAGGKPAPGRVRTIFFPGTDRELTPGRMSGIQLAPGDRIVSSAAGGGGWGDPLERDPAAVAWDVLNGYVSVDAARAEYGVVCNAEGEIDDQETEIVRSSLQEDAGVLAPGAA